MFQNCTFPTNIYATYKSHKSRRHPHCTVSDFKVELVKVDNVSCDHLVSGDHPGDLEETASDLDCPNLIENDNLQETIIQKLATVLLKLAVFSHLPCSVINGLLEELHFILSSAALSISHSVALDISNKHNLQVDQFIINELSAISANNPLVKAIANGGPLSSAFKREQYYKEIFNVVELSRSIKTFQYIPLLKSLQQLLAHKDIVDKLDNHTTLSTNVNQYVCYRMAGITKASLFLVRS